MQNVSESWKNTMLETIVPESFVEISYKRTDYDAETDATSSDNGRWDYSKTLQITDLLDKTYPKYATLERNMWLLDGSFPIFDNLKDVGFVSSVCSDNSKVFQSHPVITISFSKTHTVLIPGITINWSRAFDEWADSFIVTAYNGDVITAQKAVENNSEVISFVETDISEYDKITVEITKWCLPLRRARIEEITIGQLVVFDKSTITEFENTQSLDLLSLELPKSEVVFSVSNLDGEWNPNNFQGVHKYLLERQEIKVKYGYKINNSIEWIKCGTFYIGEWETPQNGITAKFTARDLFEFMQDEFTVTNGTFTLYELSEQALIQSDLPLHTDGTTRWIISERLKEITVTFPIEDFKYTRAEVLQLCANASRCVLHQNRGGRIVIEPLSEILTDYLIDSFVSYKNPEYEVSKELKSVSVNESMGKSENAPTGEIQTIENPLITTEENANSLAEWVKNCLKNRITVEGEYRSDPRLDASDRIILKDKYTTQNLYITELKYKYNGAFKGTYKGRVM